MAGSMVSRERVGPIDAPAMVRFREAMTGIQNRGDNKGFNYIAGFHGGPGWYCWHNQINPKTPVQARLFLPWHRAYLWWLEQALQDWYEQAHPNEDESATLPWWDWTRDRQIPQAYRTNPLRGSSMSIPRTRRNRAINRNTSE